MRVLSVLLGLLLLALGTGLLAAVPLLEHQKLVGSLLTASSMIFAIIGAWIAVLDPLVFLESPASQPEGERTQLAFKLIPLLMVATVVLCATLFLTFVYPFVVEGARRMEDGWLKVCQTASGGVITALYLAELWVIVSTLLPVAKLRRKKRSDEVWRNYE